MTQHKKHISLLLLAGALVSLILLAASLSNLQLHSGSPFPGGGNSDNAIQPINALPPIKTYSLPMLQGIFALILLILMIYLPARMIMLVNLKKLLRLALTMVSLLILVYMLPRIAPGQPAYYPSESSELIAPPSFNYLVTPLGQPPQILIWIVIFAIALGISIITYKILKRWLAPIKIEDELLQEAEQAVNALRAGTPIRNVIIHCYLQMTRALQKEQSIERDSTMTVREFEDRLELLGFPPIPVHLLTRLFEKVRYGEGQLGDNDEKIAIESLNEIIQFCRSESV